MTNRLLPIKITKGQMWYKNQVGKVFFVNSHQFRVANRKKRAFVLHDRFLFIEEGHFQVLSPEDLQGEVSHV